MTKRGLALLLTLVLCAGILQLPVLAADESAGTVQEAAIQDVTEETVTPSGPDTPADTTAPDADGSDDTTAPDADGSDDTTAPDADVPEDDTAPSDFSSKIPEAIEPPVTPAKPAKPTDGDISLFYDENNIAVIVRCADRSTTVALSISPRAPTPSAKWRLMMAAIVTCPLTSGSGCARSM